MPIYEYECKKCGHRFEELVFGSDVPECPECHSHETEKMISRCCHFGDRGSDFGAEIPTAGGGCSGCAGGNCASCGH